MPVRPQRCQAVARAWRPHVAALCLPRTATRLQHGHLLTVQVGHPAAPGLCIRGSVCQGPAATRELGLEGGDLALSGSQFGVGQLEFIPQPAQVQGL